jgi:hypothetical protein
MTLTRDRSADKLVRRVGVFVWQRHDGEGDFGLNGFDMFPVLYN